MSAALSAQKATFHRRQAWSNDLLALPSAAVSCPALPCPVWRILPSLTCPARPALPCHVLSCPVQRCPPLPCELGCPALKSSSHPSCIVGLCQTCASSSPQCQLDGAGQGRQHRARQDSSGQSSRNGYGQPENGSTGEGRAAKGSVGQGKTAHGKAKPI